MSLNLLFTGKIRLKLLTRFFLNPEVQAHLRGLANDLDVSSNAVRQELDLFKKLDLIQEVGENPVSTSNGRATTSADADSNTAASKSKSTSKKRGPKNYTANTKHPVFKGLNMLIRQHVGLDALMEKMIRIIGKPDQVYLTGPLAEGKDTPFIDLIIVAEDLNLKGLYENLQIVEQLIDKKIRTAVYRPDEWATQKEEALALPHMQVF